MCIRDRSKAIGRRGQNVRLASKLINYEIDIITYKEDSERRQAEFKDRSQNFIKNLEVDETLGQLLVSEGFQSIEEISQAKAEDILKQQGLSNALKKSGRETSEGVIQSYIHAGNKIGAMVELKCETDFVARTEEFISLAKDLAMQVAAMSPEFIYPEDEGADSSSSEEVLISQSFIKDPSLTIVDMIKSMISKVVENIIVSIIINFDSELPNAIPVGIYSPPKFTYPLGTAILSFTVSLPSIF